MDHHQFTLKVQKCCSVQRKKFELKILIIISRLSMSMSLPIRYAVCPNPIYEVYNKIYPIRPLYKLHLNAARSK